MIKDKRFISGALFANIYLLEAVCRLGGSTLFNNIYHKTRPFNSNEAKSGKPAITKNTIPLNNGLVLW
jgi:hypothetical protein